jgi:hypothetical protein
VFVDLLTALLGGLLGGELHERRRRRRLARDLAEGRPLKFPGAVLGEARYCHPAGGMLRVDGTSLTWLTGPGGKAYPVPTERLTVSDLTDARRSESFLGGENVTVVCDDAGTTVRIIVIRSDLPYLATALPGLGAWIAAVRQD